MDKSTARLLGVIRTALYVKNKTKEKNSVAKVIRERGKNGRD